MNKCKECNNYFYPTSSKNLYHARCAGLRTNREYFKKNKEWYIEYKRQYNIRKKLEKGEYDN